MAEHLPPGNPVQREINGPWGDDQILAHDISSNLRALVALTANIHRPKGAAAIDPAFLPTPEERQEQAAQERPAEQVEAERDHLQAILARPHPN